ncbi:hypothetical protein [Formosa sp. S-31]|uniref:hypothetical protein n=1 Tax=Formosa sp. S-31 TaxID=2790949 RepID=UPI003EBF7B4B
MDTTKLNIRVSQETKAELDLLSISQDIPLSKIVRLAISEYMDRLQHKDKNTVEVVPAQQPSLVQSLSFTEFVNWVHDKRYNPDIWDSEELYIQFIELILEMHTDPLFNDDILIEFNKILRELKLVVSEHENEELCDGEFSFVSNTINGFDYEKFRLFMYSIRFDEENNKILFIK